MLFEELGKGDLQKKKKMELYKYYIHLRWELGYDDDSHPDFPKIENADDIVKMVQIDALVIPVPGVYKVRCVNLALSCSWDKENGVGIRFLNKKSG